MTVARWVSSFEFAYRLGLRPTPYRLGPKATKAEQYADKLVMDAFYKRLERGRRLPQPDARMPELRWHEATVEAFMSKAEHEAKKRSSRGTRGAGRTAKGQAAAHA